MPWRVLYSARCESVAVLRIILYAIAVRNKNTKYWESRDDR